MLYSDFQDMLVLSLPLHRATKTTVQMAAPVLEILDTTLWFVKYWLTTVQVLTVSCASVASTLWGYLGARIMLLGLTNL
jgi:hypothetical protein